MLSDLKAAAPPDPKFLFRAHSCSCASQPTFVPDINISFDLGFKREVSLDAFAIRLALHLNKTQEKAKVKSAETPFLSMSPILEWAVHLTGQKERVNSTNNTVGLAIFDEGISGEDYISCFDKTVAGEQVP